VNRRFAIDRRLRWWGRDIVGGGSPWRLMRVSPVVSVLLERARRHGFVDEHASQRRVLDTLVDRGVLHPRPEPRPGHHDVTVVVPAYRRPAALAGCLRSLSGLDVVVVDDGTPEPSPLRDVAAAAGARYVRLPVNRGPAAARNAGLARASSTLVAFVDSDCQPQPGWLDALVPFFDDPRVAAVAPRVVSAATDDSALSRFERASSALDMGRHPSLVRPLARLGFVPSATLLVRLEAVATCPFDEALRLGEDVDLVWRLADAGYHVRYEPSVVVRHEPRESLCHWAARRFEYGTSTVDLEARHPGRLAPVRASPWNVAALLVGASGRPVTALGVTAVAVGLLARRLRGRGIDQRVAVRAVTEGLVADAVAVGQALRREYWPLGAAAVLAAPRSRLARVAVGAMAAPVLAEWWRERPRLDPLRYTGLRLLADAAYGSGVLANCLRRRTGAPLVPGRRRDPARASERPAFRAGAATPAGDR
jgi:mycofactocin system glycosyltransferase